MTKELDIIRADVLSPEESRALDTELDRIIHRYKGNRKEINKLVFESIACMTEADEVQTALSSKGFFKRLWGGFSGDNSRLQNKINENRAAAQHASQRTLQKLAEQNLMTFDLIAAVNHKLNASLNRVDDEFAHIYEGLLRFFKYNRNELVKLETRIDKLEQNVNLLTWQNSIEYQDLNGVEYAELDIAGKMVCLTKDFYDITKGVWETKDLLLLKTAMSTVDLQPKEQVNYMSVLKTISDRADLKEKLLQGKQLKQIEDPGYLISMGTLGKLDSLKNEESYIVDTVENYLKDNQVPADKEEIGVNLTYKYMAEKAQVNPNIDVNCYDMMLDLLYNLREAEENQLLVFPGNEKALCGENNENLLEPDETQINEESLFVTNDKDFIIDNSRKDNSVKSLMGKAETLFINSKLKEAFPLFEQAAKLGDGRAMFFVGEYFYYNYGGVPRDIWEAGRWWRNGRDKGNTLAAFRIILATNNNDEKENIIKEHLTAINKMSEDGDIFAKYVLATYYYEEGLAERRKDCSYESERKYKQAFPLFKQLARQDIPLGNYYVGKCYYLGYGIECNILSYIEYINKAVEQGWPEALVLMGRFYGHGYDGIIASDEEKAMELYQKAFTQDNSTAMLEIGKCYQYGHGVEQDYGEALRFYKMAALQNNTEAMRMIGYCYQDGDGVEKSEQKTKYWFTLAADLGDKKAANDLRHAIDFFRMMDGIQARVVRS